MLTIYRRHLKNCEHHAGGRKYRRCQCPIWADGFLGGIEIRKSLRMRDWTKANEQIREWESDGQERPAPGEPTTTIADACAGFVADVEARNLTAKTVYKYRLLFRQMQAFAGDQGLRFLKQLDTAALRTFRATWKDHNLAALKKLDRLRGFFRFARDNNWIPDNPASKIANPKVVMRPTLPFTQDEMLRILGGTTQYIESRQPHGRQNAQRLRALVFLLRYTGLRIGDAVNCSVDHLIDSKIRLYTAKTGTHVHCPLPDFVVRELEATSRLSPSRWFWTGNGKLETAVGDWQGRLQELFRIAKIQGGHAHRFRDTFAVGLLLEGVPLERVSMMLGHTSLRITEKHYAPWVRERQEQAEADVRRTWAHDPIALLETKGTLQVHGNCEAPN